jgi:hypothetical protein
VIDHSCGALPVLLPGGQALQKMRFRPGCVILHKTGQRLAVSLYQGTAKHAVRRDRGDNGVPPRLSIGRVKPCRASMASGTAMPGAHSQSFPEFLQRSIP